jgi:cytoskeletal protein CcmA (bactofilin family)
MDAVSTIGQGTLVRGSVRGEGDLEILGRVEGSVAVGGELSIGEGALVKSDVSGRNVTVRGAVLGNVSAEDTIVLEPGARVVGNLGAPRIGIRAGALVRGDVATGAPLAQAAAAAPGAAAARGRPAAAPARASAATPVQRAASAARPAPAPAARPAPPARSAPARPAPAPAPRVEAPPAEAPGASHAEDVEDAAARAPAEEVEAHADDRAAEGPPPPVVPAIRKGQKAQMRRKGAR